MLKTHTAGLAKTEPRIRMELLRTQGWPLSDRQMRPDTQTAAAFPGTWRRECRRSLIRSGNTSLSERSRPVRSARLCNAAEQRRRGRGSPSDFDAGPAGGEQHRAECRPDRDRDNPAAVLQMIDDLQRRAQRIVRRPGGAALAVHIEHEAADRHRRIARNNRSDRPSRDSAAWSHPAGTRSSRSCACRGDRPRSASAARNRTACGIVVALRRAGPPPARRAARAFRPAQASHDRRCRRRRARIRRTPGSGRDGAASISQRRDRKILVPMALARTQVAIGVACIAVPKPSAWTRALPHAAAPARMLIGGIEGERHIDRGDRRQRHAPQAATAR